MQPTVVDYKSFIAWKDEAFALWGEPPSSYPVLTTEGGDPLREASS